MSVNQTFFLQGSVSTLLSPHSSVTNCREVSVKFTVSCCSPATYPLTFVNGNVEKRPSDRNEVHLGLPSKGRMAADTLDLLKDCQLSVRQVNPRQYVAEIPQDIVRKLVSGDLDLGIVGLDTVYESGQGDEDHHCP